jgi:hypothetical protein
MNYTWENYLTLIQDETNNFNLRGRDESTISNHKKNKYKKLLNMIGYTNERLSKIKNKQIKRIFEE